MLNFKSNTKINVYPFLVIWLTRHPEFISGSHFMMLICNHYEIPSQAENDVNYKFMSFYAHTVKIINQRGSLLSSFFIFKI